LAISHPETVVGCPKAPSANTEPYVCVPLKMAPHLGLTDKGSDKISFFNHYQSKSPY
jgi:hypothetical protein